MKLVVFIYLYFLVFAHALTLDEIRRIFRGRDKLNNFLITFKNKEKTKKSHIFKKQLMRKPKDSFYCFHSENIPSKISFSAPQVSVLKEILLLCGRLCDTADQVALYLGDTKFTASLTTRSSLRHFEVTKDEREVDSLIFCPGNRLSFLKAVLFNALTIRSFSPTSTATPAFSLETFYGWCRGAFFVALFGR